LRRTYSADQIAALSKLSNSAIEELVRFGLLDPRGGLFGFRDLASARQTSKLFAHGIALSEILRSVNEVRQWLPEADLSNLRLHPVAHHTLKLNSPEGEPITAANLCCRSIRLRRTPMLYFNRPNGQRRLETSSKLSASIGS
jgi:hypothetical protein